MLTTIADNQQAIEALDDKVLDLIRDPILSGDYADYSVILSYASYFGWMNTINFLVARIDDINKNSGWRYITERLPDSCILKSFASILRKQELLDIDESLDQQIYASSPFLLAATSNREDIIKVLINNGAKIENELDGFPIIYALTELGNINALNHYIKVGADVHATDHYGNTALHRAAWKRNVEAAKILIAAGSKLHAKAAKNDDKSPINTIGGFFSSDEDKREMTEFLKSAKEQIETAYTTGASRGAFDNKLPPELSAQIGLFSTRREGGNLASTSKKAALQANSNEAIAINEIGNSTINRADRNAEDEQKHMSFMKK